MNKNILGVLLMVTAAVLFAISTLLMKYIPEFTQLNPGHLAVWRFIIAAPMMAVFILVKHSPNRFFPKGSLRFIGLGVIYSIASFSAIFALERLSASIYVIVVYIYPALVVVYTLLSGGSVPKTYWIGLPMAILGLVLTAYDFNQVFQVDWIGLLITILNAIAISAYVFLSGKVLKKSNLSLLGTNIIFFGGMLVGLFIGTIFGFRVPGSTFGWLLVFAFGVFGTLLPILLMNYGVQMLGAARGSVIMPLQPVLTVLLSVIFFNDVLTTQQWLGGFLVLAAIILLQLRSDNSSNTTILNKRA